MEKMSKDPIKKFAEAISKDNKLFKKQLKEVKEKYPLVMLAYRIQQAVITELSMPRFITDMEIGPLYTTIESVQSEGKEMFSSYFSTDSMAKSKAWEQQRLADLKTCMMRANMLDSRGEQYLAGVECLEKFAANQRR